MEHRVSSGPKNGGLRAWFDQKGDVDVARRALISVSDKAGVVEFARGLSGDGI